MTYCWKRGYCGCVEIYKYMYRKWPRRTDLRWTHIKRWLQTEPWRHWLQIPPSQQPRIYTHCGPVLTMRSNDRTQFILLPIRVLLYNCLLNFRRVKREWIKDFQFPKEVWMEHRNFVTYNPLEINNENDPFRL